MWLVLTESLNVLAEIILDLREEDNFKVFTGHELQRFVIIILYCK
jgi:hypothetical protein